MKKSILAQVLIDFLAACGVAVVFWFFQQHVPSFLQNILFGIGLIFLFVGALFVTSEVAVLPGPGLGLLAMGLGLANLPVKFTSITFISALLAVGITLIGSLVAMIRPEFNNFWRHALSSLVLTLAVCLLLAGFSLTNFLVIFALFLFLTSAWGLTLNTHLKNSYPMFATTAMFAVATGFYCLQNLNPILEAIAG